MKVFTNFKRSFCKDFICTALSDNCYFSRKIFCLFVDWLSLFKVELQWTLNGPNQLKHMVNSLVILWNMENVVDLLMKFESRTRMSNIKRFTIWRKALVMTFSQIFRTEITEIYSHWLLPKFRENNFLSLTHS